MMAEDPKYHYWRPRAAKLVIKKPHLPMQEKQGTWILLLITQAHQLA